MRALLLIGALALTACVVTERPTRPQLTTFEVEVTGVFQQSPGGRLKLPVATRCSVRYGGEASVPDGARGQPDCPLVIPRGEIELDVVATAKNQAGQLDLTFNGPVSFRVLPGSLSGDYDTRWAQANQGIAHVTVKSVHQYGKVRVWAEDAPVELYYDGGGLGGTPGLLPPEPLVRTYATGVSRELSFENQTLQSLQVPDGFDNRSSPFVGEFVTVGLTPESGETLVQNCVNDPSRDQKPALMVVTGIDPGGFFVTDLSACRLQEWLTDSTGASQVRTPEPPEPCVTQLADGGWIPLGDAGVGVCEVSHNVCHSRADCPAYLPGTFGSMYVYNYSFPDGLNQGDWIFTISGAVQEFTSTTQMVFPAWSIAEKVRELPPSEWDKYLRFAKPVEITDRLCGMDNTFSPYMTDVLCGHNKRNLKMESLESALVKVRNVRFPDEFVNCDFNNDQSVPFFCENPLAGAWGYCGAPDPEAPNDQAERECNQACILGTGDHTGRLCMEESTFIGFGQYVVELQPPGPGSLGLDDSLPARAVPTTIPMADGGTADQSVKLAFAIPAGSDFALSCDTPVHYVIGAGTVAATAADPLLPAGTPLKHTILAGEGTVAVLATDRPGTCWMAQNMRARINIVTKDAAPELAPDCDLNDAVPEKARQCHLTQEATYDIVGHLRHLQPGRPRWAILPRDPDDICCHPGANSNGECPKPLSVCK